MNELILDESTDVSFVLESVVDGMLEGFQVISPAFQYVYVNETVAKHGKKTKEELIGRTMMECYPGIETTAMFMQLQRCLQEQVSSRFENEFVYPDGSSGWFQLCIHPIKSGLLILSVDITERKNAEIALKEKIHEVDILMNSTTDREVRMGELKKEISNLKAMAS